MKRIAAITFARSDFSSLLPVLRVLRGDKDIECQLVVSGAHLAEDFGNTARDIEAEGITIDDRVDMHLVSDRPEELAASLGMATGGLAESLSKLKPEVLILVGDRFDLLAATAAAALLRIPIAHISGGDVTEGAIDNQVRYAVTAMSHLHFVAMQEHADRLIGMGEESWRVRVTGDPALDLVRDFPAMSRDELSAGLGLDLRPPLGLVSYHPATLTADPKIEIGELLAALADFPGTLIFTMPGAESGGRQVADEMKRFTTGHASRFFTPSLGQRRYYSLMACADVMMGNSSSGIWESPTFALPAVNIGERQKGRIRVRNVIDVPPERNAIKRALREATSPAFRNSLRGLANPYGDGRAAARIAARLKEVLPSPSLMQKQFLSPVAAARP